jgi:DNA-binding response OmpR family regulator
MESTFEDVLADLRPLAGKKSQVFSVDCAPGLTVRADSMRLKQVLMNLVGNAIKFTPEGGRISLQARPENGAVRIEVRDSGPGILPEEQKRIFEAFVRLQKPGKSSEGTGLGLAITQRLVELHGGHLGLESEPGKGSCFYFLLSSTAGRTEPKSKKPDEELRLGGRVLVVEDDPVAARLIEIQLQSEGFEVSICDRPNRAADLAAELQPRAITLDVLMNPTMGWEVLAQLKNDSRTSAIPVIIVTVVDQPAVGATLGAEEYLVKPVQKEALLAAVRRCLRKQKAADGAGNILVVEDDSPTREMIAELLRAEKFSVATAADGAEARAAVAEALPCLIILDLLLPKVSGFELLSEWRAERRTAGLPIFVLTSKDLSAEELQYLQANAKSLFRKQQPWKQVLLEQLRQATGHNGGKIN